MNHKLKHLIAFPLAALVVVLAVACVYIPKPLPKSDPLTPPDTTTPPEPISLLDALAYDYEHNDTPGGNQPFFERLDSMSPYFADQIARRVPAEPRAADKSIDSPWLSQFDWSGVTWSNKRTATAIHPRLVVMAAHYTRAVGDVLTWAGRDGVEVSRVLIAKRAASADRAIGILDAPLPDTVNFYRIMPHRYNWPNMINGSLIFITDQEGKALVFNLRSGGSTRSGGDSYHFMEWERPPEQYATLHEDLVSGDSGNPSFLVYEGELVLLCTSFYAHAGPMVTQGGFYLDKARELLAMYPDPTTASDGGN